MAIDLEVIQTQLGKRGKLVTQDTVDEINNLIDDPEYGEDFLEKYINFFNIMDKNKLWSTPKYMNAMKFYTLVDAEHSLVDAYIKVFPERLAARIERGQNKTDMGGEASRFNSSELVNEIRKAATVPVQLIHRNLLHKAILKTADLMVHSRSELVQQKAAETLIRELKPSEDSTVNIKVGMSDEAKSQQAKLVDHIGNIALQQQKMLAAGMNIAEIQKLNIQISSAIDVDVEDAEYE